jgi:hypothetical protein
MLEAVHLDHSSMQKAKTAKCYSRTNRVLLGRESSHILEYEHPISRQPLLLWAGP